MNYSIIVIVASVVLVTYFLFSSKAKFASKAVVSGIFVFSFACFFWLRGWSLVGLFLQVASNIFILLNRACQQAVTQANEKNWR
jgi:hypothetical protein